MMIILFAPILFLPGLVEFTADLAEGDEKTSYKITTRKKEDTVGIHTEKDRTVLVVGSPSGIGQADIERLEANWPRVVVLRLHLKGLESFRASNGTIRLDASVSVHEGKPRVRLWKDGKEESPLDEKNQFWTDIRIVNRDSTPAKGIPLKDGYFEITLPKAFFEGNPKSITLNWIDFYR